MDDLEDSEGVGNKTGEVVGEVELAERSNNVFTEC